MGADGGKVLRLENRHREGMSRARRVTEQINSAAVDVVLKREQFDEIVQELRAIFRDAPTFWGGGVWGSEDDAFLLREWAPRIDERLAVPPRPVEKHKQRRRFLGRIGNEEVVGSGPSAGTESL